jgi:hypothetical protein
MNRPWLSGARDPPKRHKRRLSKRRKRRSTAGPMCGLFPTIRYVGTVLAVGWIIGSRSGLAAAPLSGGPGQLREERARVAETNSAGSGGEAHRPQRDFVRAWKINDLRRDLNRIGAGRSFGMGKALFSAANCDQCHRLNRIGSTVLACPNAWKY